MPNICITEEHMDSIYFIINEYIKLHGHNEELHKDDLAAARDVKAKMDKEIQKKNYFIKDR